MSQHLHARMEQSAQLLTPTLSRPKLTTNGNELPEAVVVEDAGAAMAGFVGLLRQLGDLAQLAAEVFHGLHGRAASRWGRGGSRRHCRSSRGGSAIVGMDGPASCTHTLVYFIGQKFRVASQASVSIEKHIHHCRGPPQLSKFKTGALSDTLRQLKYRHMIRRIRRQMHNFQNQDSSEDEASEAHVLSSADSPEMSDIRVPGTAVPGADKERSSYLVERTSSFGAWLSPGAACTRACDITQDNADGFASHGCNKADKYANIATNSSSALVDFIASRVKSSPRKLSVKKRGDPLTESFRNMAKKLLLENEPAENFLNNNLAHSEDVPDEDEVAFSSKSTKET